jgi:hypothetical protein
VKSGRLSDRALDVAPLDHRPAARVEHHRPGLAHHRDERRLIDPPRCERGAWRFRRVAPALR